MATVESIKTVPARHLTAEDLQRLYLEIVFAYVSRRLPCREDAEDATAETFAAAFAHLRRMRSRDPKLWLLGIARRKVVDIYRRTKRKTEIPLEEISNLAHLEHGDRDQVIEVRKLVLGLPEDQREALLLQFVEGFNQDEIAKIMGRSKAAINGLQQRARANVLRGGQNFFLSEDPS